MVVGCGGSSLSGKALACIAPAALAAGKKLHVLDNLDADGTAAFLAHTDIKDCCFFIVSKSGGTLETLAFVDLIFSALDEARIFTEIARRTAIMTMEDTNPLRKIAEQYAIPTLPHSPHLGGRFSILSAVGLLPAAFLGVNIHALRKGAAKALAAPSYSIEATALHYACLEGGINMHVMMPYSERLIGLAQWWRQAWAESLGKQQKGSTPIISLGPCDQHSQLQLYLDGPRDKLFTLLLPKSQGTGPTISENCEAEYIRGKTLGDITGAMQRATAETLMRNGCPVRKITIDAIEEETAGALLMQWTMEILLTAHLLQINPFDQPAVEESKHLARTYLTDCTF